MEEECTGVGLLCCETECIFGCFDDGVVCGRGKREREREWEWGSVDRIVGWLEEAGVARTTAENARAEEGWGMDTSE